MLTSPSTHSTINLTNESGELSMTNYSTEAKVLRVMKSQLRTANQSLKNATTQEQKDEANKLINELLPLIQDFETITAQQNC